MKLDIICVPVFEGCNIKGVEKAPQALLDAGAFKVFEKYHNVNLLNTVNVKKISDDIFSECKNIKFKPEMLELTKDLCKII